VGQISNSSIYKGTGTAYVSNNSSPSLELLLYLHVNHIMYRILNYLEGSSAHRFNAEALRAEDTSDVTISPNCFEQRLRWRP